jgi:hypothetical protein
VPDGNLADRLAALSASATGDDGVATVTVGARTEAGRVVLDTLTRRVPAPAEPAMPVMPFPTFENVPTLPHQAPGNGFESGRDSRAR